MSHTPTPAPTTTTTQRRWLLRALHDETVGGLLLVTATVVAVAWANSPWSASYTSFTHAEVRVPGMGLTVTEWASDLLLAIFFFVVGVELKHEIAVGSLANPRTALVPILAALGGMSAAAGLFLAVNHGSSAAAAWAVPVSTDVAFALAVLALIGRRLPLELRAFLLTVAVVNDLGAIAIIAVFYGQRIDAASLLGAAAVIAAFWSLQQRGFRSLWLHVPLAAAAWLLVYRSGVHATMAGVALGIAMRVESHAAESPGDAALRWLRPVSAGVCVPLFALVSAGFPIPTSAASSALSDPLLIGIVLGLVVGQPLGVTLGAFVATRITRAGLPGQLAWWDVVVVGMLAALGFTVAMLVSHVSFAAEPGRLDVAKLGIISANLIAIVLVSGVVAVRTSIPGRYRR